MKRLSYSEFLESRERFDAAVSSTPELATYCSSFLWQTAAHDSMQTPQEDDEYLILEDEGNWVVLAEREGRHIFFPLESSWMFGCPLVGDPAHCFTMLKEASESLLTRPVGFCFGGIRKEGAMHQILQGHQNEFLQFEEFPATDCMEIDLSDGFEGWLARRSKRFRKAAMKSLLPADCRFEDASEEAPEVLLERMISIQQQSHKSAAGGDIFEDEGYRNFYRLLLRDLHSRGDLRFLFVRRGEEDLAYIFGGLQREIYRGFQMSYVESARDMGLGNLLQLQNIEARAAEGILRYDLGMHSLYKERWADRRDEYGGVFIVL